MNVIMTIIFALKLIALEETFASKNEQKISLRAKTSTSEVIFCFIKILPFNFFRHIADF